MKRLMLIILLLALTVSASAQIGTTPDYTLLWNNFKAVRSVGSYVLAISTDGVAVLEYNVGLDQFVHINELFLDQSPSKMKVYGDTLIVRTTGDSLIVLNLAELPELSRIGAFHTDWTFDDFEYSLGSIYTSNWFEGIWRYSGSSFNSYHFVDSTMKPILVSQLEMVGDTLMALDEYNGIYREVVDENGFTGERDYLYTPFRLNCFRPFEGEVLLSETNGGIWIGEFGRAGSGITQWVTDTVSAVDLRCTYDLFVIVDERNIRLVNRSDSTDVVDIALDEIKADGDIISLVGNRHYVTPDRYGGLVSINLDSAMVEKVMYRPGPITGLEIIDGKLFTGGTDNPIDVFSFDLCDGPVYEFTLFDGLGGIASMDHNGDSLLALFDGPNKLGIISNAVSRDEYYLENSISLRHPDPLSIEFRDHWNDSSSAVVVTSRRDVSTYALIDSSAVMFDAAWSMYQGIFDATVIDSFLIVSTEKRTIVAYRILDGEDVQYAGQVTLAVPATDLVKIGGQVVYFDDDKMNYLSCSETGQLSRDTVVQLKLPVTRSVIDNDRLLTVGRNGFAIYELEGNYPELVTYGGRAGSYIAADSNVVVTSSGSSVHVYYLNKEDSVSPPPELPDRFYLSQNYPNPFNPITAIDFELQEAAIVKIEVFNLLGQRVAVILHNKMSAGRQTVYWDASAVRGDPLASGVYIYRMQAGDYVQSRKMMLLK
ncbi:MAG TPA: T9SS type A sorting domain-containing protein [candidate division Zixibacteria bacterium]|nr:T9SS type A sorting domain-containing protein [candidate division Zixibacteria bacterium]